DAVGRKLVLVRVLLRVAGGEHHKSCARSETGSGELEPEVAVLRATARPAPGGNQLVVLRDGALRRAGRRIDLVDAPRLGLGAGRATRMAAVENQGHEEAALRHAVEQVA